MTESFGPTAVLGCGNMGAALARALVASGRRVVVWNRTAARAEALAADGAEVCADVTDAVQQGGLVITCLGTTDDVRAVLASLDPRHLAGRTLLNVTTGTPQDAQDLRDWAQERGLQYLDAAIGAYPEQIGTSEARILVAGDESLWQAHRDTVCALAGASLYVGANPGAANVIDAAMTGAFYISSLVSFVEATRFMAGQGVTYDVLAELVGYGVGVLEHQLRQILQRIEQSSYATNEATLGVYADAAEAFAAGMAAVGEAPMIQATARVLRQGVESGLGDLDLAALCTDGSYSPR